jgi:hypothetical protein
MKLRARVLASVFLFALAAVVVPLVQPASAAGNTITVNTVTDASVPGKCSLRSALQASDTNSAVEGCHKGSATGQDTIVFASSTNGHAFNLASGLDVDSPVILKGNGRSKTVIKNFEFDAIFSARPATFEHMTLVDVSNEDATANIIDVKATAELNNNSGSGETSIMHVSHSTFPGVTNNSGIDNTATSTLTITKSVVTDVIDNNSGSGSVSHLTVTNSKTGEIDNNSGSADGSVTTATIKNTTVTGTGSSSGIDDSSSGTSVLISGSTVSKFDTGVTNDGKSTKIVNSTITGNKTSTVENDSGKTTVVNSTLTKGFTGILQSGGSVKATNTIIAAQAGSNCIGTVASGGGNISDDGTCHFAGSRDHNNKNPKLGTLGVHGGPTKTFVPLAGSPAIDGGLNAPCPGTDQRGKKRPQDGDGNGSKICDVGSVEVVP